MTLRRWLALCGVAAPVLIVLTFVVGGDTPDDKASAPRVVSFYRSHKSSNIIASLMIAIAAVLLVLFAARLRDALRGSGARGDTMPIAAFGGAVVLAVGMLFLGAVHFALVQAADHRLAAPAQTLNVLDNNDFFVIVGGAAILMLSAGVATVRQATLPRWLGWAAIVIGILTLAGPAGFFGVIGSVVWILVVAILLLARRDVDTESEAGPGEVLATE
jgi:hypothetical protein